MSIRTLLNTASGLVVVALLLVTVVLTLQTKRLNSLEQSQCKVWAVPQGTCEKF